MKTSNYRFLRNAETGIMAFIALVIGTFLSCSEPAYINSPSDNTKNYDSIPGLRDPDPTADPEGIVVPEGTINVYEAVKIGKALEKGTSTSETYYIKGWVRNFDEKERAKSDFESKFAQYGNDYVHLSARQDGAGTKDFYCYRILGKNGSPLPDHEALQVGDFVVVKCKIQNYNSIVESSGTCALVVSNNPHFNEVFPPFPGCPEPGEGEISVTQAKAISDSIGTGKTTTETYKIRGVVTSVNSVTDSDLAKYGNLTFNISSDGDITATCYRIKAKGNAAFTDRNQLLVGDTVLVNAKIQNYNGTCEPVQGYVEESTNANFNAKFNAQ